MKKALILLALCCTLNGALAEAVPTPTPTPLESATTNFLDSLSTTWNAFLGMAGEAGTAVSNGVNGFLQQNFPEFQKWLEEAGRTFNENVTPELSEAWNTLVEGANQIGSQTQQEIQRAYEALQEYLNSTNADQSLREAVDGVASAAGANVEK